MGYSNYKKIKTLIKKFDLKLKVESLFSEVTSVAPSSWLKESLDKAEITLLTSEKAKSERLISPILLDVFQSYKTKFSFFSGESLNILPEEDLAGPCDFIFAFHPPIPYLESPIISLAEAKDDDMDWGLAQCAAQMYGAQLFNETEGKKIPVIYGCATDGIEWQFLKLENHEYCIDDKIYTDLSQILGVWHRIFKSYLK